MSQTRTIITLMLSMWFVREVAAEEKPKHIAEPKRQVAAPELGSVRQFDLLDGGKRLLITSWSRADGDLVTRVLTVDPENGKIDRTLAEEKGAWIDPRPPAKVAFLESDGKTVVVPGPERKPLRLNALTGEVIKAESAEFAAHWTLRGDLEKAGVDPAKPQHWFRLSTRAQWLGALAAEKEGESHRLVLFDPKKGDLALLAKIGEINFNVLPFHDGTKAVVMRQENPEKIEWTAVEIWDLVERKKIKRHELAPTFSTIGMKVSRDGRFIVFHEYMVQQLYVFDLGTGKFVAVVGTGCSAFDIAADGSSITALAGQWKNGTLIPTHIAVYDISGAVPKAVK